MGFSAESSYSHDFSAARSDRPATILRFSRLPAVIRNSSACAGATYGTPSCSILAAALARLGHIEEARTEGRLFMADYPDFRIEAFLDTLPLRHRADRENFAEGYRKAARRGDGPSFPLLAARSTQSGDRESAKARTRRPCIRMAGRPSEH
jgi:hypothetical protein